MKTSGFQVPVPRSPFAVAPRLVRRNHGAVRAVFVLLALCDLAAPLAFAQTSEARRGDRSLFGGVDSNAGATESLNATVFVSTTHDDDISDGQASTQSKMIGGKYSNLDAALSFSSIRRRFAITADAASSLRHYPDLDSLVSSNHSAGTTVNANLSRKTSVRARVDGSYVSSFGFEAFTRRPNVEADSQFLSGFQPTPADWTMTWYGGTAELTRTFGRRSSFALSYGTRYVERPLFEEHNTERAVALHFGQSTGRDTSVRASYTLRQGTQRMQEFGYQVRSHDVQIGVERRWRHSALRRTVVSLAAGSALLHDEPSGLQTEATVPLVSPVGSMSIRHDLKQRLTVGVSYQRGGGFSSGRGLSNAATIDVSGSAGRRTDFTVSAGYFDSDMGLDARDNRYTTSFGTARLQVALTRLIAIYGQGFLYRYHFGRLISSPSGFLPHVDRRALRAGVALWLPLIGR